LYDTAINKSATVAVCVRRCQCSLTASWRSVLYCSCASRSGIIAATFGRLHPSTLSARRQLVRRRSATAAAAWHTEHETLHYYRSIDSQDGLASVGPAKPLSHVSPFCFQLQTNRLRALIEALHDYMLYSASLQLNKMLS